MKVDVKGKLAQTIKELVSARSADQTLWESIPCDTTPLANTEKSSALDPRHSKTLNQVDVKVKLAQTVKERDSARLAVQKLEGEKRALHTQVRITLFSGNVHVIILQGHAHKRPPPPKTLQ